MCVPQSSATLTSQVFGSLSEAAGTFYSARGEKRAMQHDADISDLNARLADISAKFELERGAREEQVARLDNQSIRDRQKVGYAANGIALDSPTAVRVATSDEVFGEIDANTINLNAARAAWGYRVEGVQHKNDAGMKRALASAVSPSRRAVSSLISSVGDVRDSYARLKKEGAI